MDAAGDTPVVTNGPLVAGEESIISLYNPDQLQNYPHWSQLLPMVNHTFKINHQDFWPLDIYDRFASSKSFLDELEPDFFTFIVSSKKVDHEGHPSIYATASARTLVEHVGSSQEAYAGFRGAVRHIPGQSEAWELKILAVDVSLYRTGLGSMLQSLVEEEIKKRAKISREQLKDSATLWQEGDSTGIVYTLTTVAEANEGYYLKRGYTTIKSIVLPEGALSNVRECHIAHMEKTIYI